MPLLFLAKWTLGVTWLWPTWQEAWMLAGTAVFAYGGQIFLNRGMQRCSSAGYLTRSVWPAHEHVHRPSTFFLTVCFLQSLDSRLYFASVTELCIVAPRLSGPT